MHGNGYILAGGLTVNTGDAHTGRFVARVNIAVRSLNLVTTRPIAGNRSGGIRRTIAPMNDGAEFCGTPKRIRIGEVSDRLSRRRAFGKHRRTGRGSERCIGDGGGVGGSGFRPVDIADHNRHNWN